MDDIQKKEYFNQSYYRKRLKIKVFLREKEKILRRKIAAQMYNVSDDSAQLDGILEDEDKMKAVNANLDTIFRSRKLSDIKSILQKYNISDEELVPETKKRIDEIEKNRNDIK
jgi:predicted glycoside hydrolase/deacetylase ChbG (UPF0249 family)